MFSLTALITTALITTALFAQEQPTDTSAYPMMFFVRHAEKDLSDKGDNPSLTPAGRERAQLLAKTVLRILKEENGQPLTTIYITEYDRTKQTAQPLAEATGITPTVMNSKEVATIVSELRAHPRSCLVVAHLNTVPDIVQQLSGEPVPPIEDNEYNKLFVFTVQGRKKILNFQTFGLPPRKNKEK